MSHSRAINPWKWQDAFGFSQAIEVPAGGRWLVCSGQTSVDADGNPMHAGDMAAQLRKAFDNLEAVLKAAGLTLADVVRLNYYTTDIAAYLQASGEVAQRLPAGGAPPPAGTLLGVAALFHPDILIEIEATAYATCPIDAVLR
jgi:enamine deaminase RidA (YjgF/YER057c/UK114 family)